MNRNLHTKAEAPSVASLAALGVKTMTSPIVRAFFDEDTSTITYVVSDPKTKDSIVIDPVLDFDPLAAQTSTQSVQGVIAYLLAEKLTLRAVLETHAHADHISAAQLLKKRFAVPVAIGAGISKVQKTFARLFNLPSETKTDGSQFDVLLDARRSYAFGSLIVGVLATPGHTPACVSYHIGDAVFTGDTLFLEDYGTGRADFPGGSAKDLHSSVTKTLYSLAPETRVFVGHDYQPGGRAVRYESTIAVEREKNIQIQATTSEAEFVAFRTSRDSSLRTPRLIYPSVQVNVFGGNLPEPEENGIRYLRTPLNTRTPTDAAGNSTRGEAAE